MVPPCGRKKRFPEIRSRCQFWATGQAGSRHSESNRKGALSGEVLCRARSSDLCFDQEAEAGESPGFVDAGRLSVERKEADRSTH